MAEKSFNEVDLGQVPNAPELSENLNSSKRAIKDTSHAIEICERLISDNEDRIDEYGKIRAQADGIEPPYDNAKLDEQGKTYKSNINTGFLGTVHNKIFPRMVARLKQSRYLTAASLPDKDSFGNPIDRAKEKTELFRREVTRTIREWKRFHSFLQSVASPTSLLGISYPAYTDEMEWRPKCYLPDEAFIPNGVSQTDDEIPYFLIQEEYYIHELFEKIEDKKTAKDAGYNIKNIVKSINEAMPHDIDEDDENQTALKYEDLKRELVSATAYSTSARTIRVWNLFVVEHDGSVSQYMIDRDSQEELFKAEDRYESMDDVVVPIPFQYGNGKYHGSYGAGQLLYDIALRIEKNRNAVIDNELARGKFNIVVPDEKNLADAKLHITDEANYLSGATFAGNTAALPSTAESFIQLDRVLTSMAEEKVGAFMPEPLERQIEKTATEAQISSAKEAETREAIIDHWLSHFSLLIRTMTKRLLNPDTQDMEASKLRVALLAGGLTEEEIQYLANQYPTQTAADFTESKEQRLAGFLSSRKGDPLYNQVKLERTIATAMVGASVSDELIIPEEDQTVVIEGMRQQMEENSLINQGANVPVSPRDPHEVHMNQIKGQTDPQTGQSNSPLVFALQQGNLPVAKLMLQHYIQHVETAASQNKLGERLNEERQFIAQVGNEIKQLESQMQKAQEEQAQASEAEEQALLEARAQGQI